MSTPTSADMDLAASILERKVQARPIALFVAELVSVWCDARSLHCETAALNERASRAGIDHDSAQTELGDVLAILVRGPESGPEYALLSILAACGYALQLDAADGGERQALAERLVERFGWLELASDYRISAFLLRVLSEPAQHALVEALSRAVLREEAALEPIDPAPRARAALRLGTLANSHSEVGRRELAGLRNTAKDPITRALAAAFLADLARQPSPLVNAPRVAGISRPPSRSLGLSLLRWLSGYALLQALQRLVFFVLALRRESEIELRGDALCVRARTSLLGRTLRSSEACYEVERVTGAFRHARFALLRGVVGVLSLALGILLGGYLVFDGARGGAPLLLLLGAAVVAAGSALDLALNVLMPARQARVDVQVDLRGAGSLRLGRVEQADADRLLEALSVRLSR
jgi:hypothetical protein